jgi:hypothetical protein
VEQNEFVDSAGARKVSDQPVDGVLHLFLSGYPALTFSLGEVEDFEASDSAGRVWNCS